MWENAKEDHGKRLFFVLNVAVGLCLPVAYLMSYSLFGSQDPFLVPALLVNAVLGILHYARRKTNRLGIPVWIFRIAALLLAMVLPVCLFVRSHFRNSTALYGFRRELFLLGHYNYDFTVAALLPETVPAGCELDLYTGGAGIGPEARAQTYLFVRTDDQEWLQQLHAGRTNWKTPERWDDDMTDFPKQMGSTAVSWFRRNDHNEPFLEGEISAREGRGVYLDENAGIFLAWLVY